MKRNFAWLVLGISAVIALAAVSLDISSFKSVSVTQTNYVNEVLLTNGATIGGVRRTTWPIGSSWTNIAGVLQPTEGTGVLVTNMDVAERLGVLGALIFETPLVTNLVAGMNDLNVLEVSRVQLTGPTADPADTGINLNSGSGPGSLLILENFSEGFGFTLTNATPMWGSAPGSEILLNQGVTWAPTAEGEAMLLLQNNHGDWVEVNRLIPGGSGTNIFNNLSVTNLFVENNFTLKGNGTVIISNVTYSLIPVWTNNSGVIEPLGNGQFTNVLRFTSGLADNVTNVAVVVDTVNLWGLGSQLLSVRNKGTNEFAISPWGGIAVGAKAQHADFYGPLQISDAFRMLHITDAGESSGLDGQMAVYKDENFNEGAELFVDESMSSLTNNRTEITFGAFNDNGESSYWYMKGGVGNQAATSQLNFNDGTDRIMLRPATTASTTPFFLRTSIGHTSGDLFQIGNSTTNKFTVAYDGAIAASGQATLPSAIITNNLAAALSVGDTTFVDVSKASQTNSITAALTFAHATNGVHGLDMTHVRWIFNASGSDQTLTIPSGWRTNVYSAVPPSITNGTITRMVLACGGATASAAAQTNCYVSFEYFK